MNDGTLEDDVFIWESKHGSILAVLNREAPGSVFLQIHPDARTDELVTEMLALAEQHLAVPTKDGHRALHVWAGSEDIRLQELLRVQNYQRCANRKSEHQRRRDLTAAITPACPTDRYLIRSMGDAGEQSSRERLSWRAFNPNAPDDEFEGGWYHNVQRAPLYRRDLDLVAIAPDEELAAFATIWFDDVTRVGLFEPVGTAPQHQRRGLGKAILAEGLRRLKHMGADLAYVGSYSEPAHSLYASVGFETYRILEPWEKDMDASTRR
ncbi:MAG: GNAT family N-acetyltransferase [candidate division Zixibacteria bacterium]|nr:GNAT family N-acetyltransferase [candidate division Zixibacteria bacterium]